MSHYFQFAKERTSASILMVAPFALGPPGRRICLNRFTHVTVTQSLSLGL
jgi:hypothetical protein